MSERYLIKACVHPTRELYKDIHRSLYEISDPKIG